MNDTEADPVVDWMPCEKDTVLGLASGATADDVASDKSPLWLFLDESGNFDFGENGTKYFIMTCLATHRPFSASHDLMDAKYDCFENGLTMKKFHATEDNREVRLKVYDIIGRHSGRLSAYAVYVDKWSLSDDLRDAGKLYSNAFEWLIDEVLAREVGSGTSRVIVVTDDIPKEAKRKQVAKPLKKLLKGFSLRSGIPACLEHFPSESEFNLQIADYLCWAFMRKEAVGQDWPYSKVKGIFSETGYLTV